MFTATALLTNLRADMAGRPGMPLFSPDAQARLSTEALAHAVLALDSTLTRLLDQHPAARKPSQTEQSRTRTASEGKD